jgi:hypothetical protein
MTEALGYRIEINGENEAFAEGNFHDEMCRILTELAIKIGRGRVGDSEKLRDVNGNVVGECIALF